MKKKHLTSSDKKWIARFLDTHKRGLTKKQNLQLDKEIVLKQNEQKETVLSE